MATIKEVKTQIQNANALGIANLTEKGVDISADATTYDIMTAIAEVVGGGGIEYTDITYNEDNTITLTDKDGVDHTMECEYTEGKLTSVKYDGKVVKLTYDGDVLVKVGKSAVDMSNAPTTSGELLDHTVKFMVDGEPYEVVSVKDGNEVNAPTKPTKEGEYLKGWKTSESDYIAFPYIPTGSITLFSEFAKLLSDLLYFKLGVSRSEYPHFHIEKNVYEVGSNLVRVRFFNYDDVNYTNPVDYWIRCNTGIYCEVKTTVHTGSYTYEEMIDIIVNSDDFTKTVKQGISMLHGCYTNCEEFYNLNPTASNLVV